MKIGAITIGQAPRVDVTGDVMEIFHGKAELLQGGGLDGLTREEIETFKPEDSDYVLVSRLTDGSSVTFAERHILPRLQQRIYDLEAQGVKFIMFFCTGDFPDTFKSKVPLIFPCKILNHIVPLLTKTSNIITVTPSPLQVAQCEEKWRKYVNQVTSIPASPYGDWETLTAAAERIKDMEGDLVVLDCIGYTQEMKEMFAKITGKMIVLSRTILARVVSELTDI
ncbi:AroM family protein [uncultured Robinsoniella sp.]|uniref:AroM family protein n=1 Tax=uncultured Robinsoniella sp. TaxID=904190 RepID=UPI00374F8F48